MQIEQLKSIIEAALLASTQPLPVQRLRELFTAPDEVEPGQIADALEVLAADCAGRGVELVEVASGYRYQVRQDIHPWIKRMWTERPGTYSRAMLETLALIAYRQPITRPEIEQIRGVVVSSSMVKTMEEREWIRVVGYRDVPGKPALYGTTRAFLDYFNLQSLDQLPPLSEIREMEDPQLRLDNPEAAMPDTSNGSSNVRGELEWGGTETPSGDADMPIPVAIDGKLPPAAWSSDASSDMDNQQATPPMASPHSMADAATTVAARVTPDIAGQDP